MIVKKMGRGVKVGPVFFAAHSLAVSVGGYGLGMVGRNSLNGAFNGWSLFVEAKPLNRKISMSIDKPTISRWHW